MAEGTAAGGQGTGAAAGPVPLAVTISAKPEPALVAEAREASARWGLPFVFRPKKGPLGELLGCKALALVVFERKAVTLVDAEGQLSFHAGMAHLRMQRLGTGEGDTMVRVAGLQPGDAVLDCTLGLGQDALVAARAVGPTGRVVGVERSLALFAVLEAGLRRQGAYPDSCLVEARHADSLEFLRAQPDHSFDVVVFDPMFERPTKSQPAFELVRRHADHSALTEAHLAEARRVARRCVLVKAAKYSPTLKRLGLEAQPGSRYTDVVWAVMEVAGGG